MFEDGKTRRGWFVRTHDFLYRNTSKYLYIPWCRFSYRVTTEDSGNNQLGAKHWDSHLQSTFRDGRRAVKEATRTLSLVSFEVCCEFFRTQMSAYSRGRSLTAAAAAVCMCVCERERGRERVDFISIYFGHESTTSGA